MSVALVIQYAKRMRSIIFKSVVCLAPPYFSTLSQKRHDFRQKVNENVICVFIFSTRFEVFLILRIIQQDTVIKAHR